MSVQSKVMRIELQRRATLPAALHATFKLLLACAGMTELCPMGTIGGLKGTLGPLTKEQRLAIRSKQVINPALSRTRHCASSPLAAPVGIVSQWRAWGGLEHGAFRY